MDLGITEEEDEDTPATGAPNVSGTAQVGLTLTAVTSGIADADGRSNAIFSYQWLADDTDMAGATGNSYVLVADDEDKAIKVRVTFTDDRNHQESLTSAATAAVTPAVDDSSIWSATLLAVSIWGFSGFWDEAEIGEITPQVFTLDGVEYTVQAMVDYVGLDIVLILDKPSPSTSRCKWVTPTSARKTPVSPSVHVPVDALGSSFRGWRHRGGQPDGSRLTCAG